MSIDPYTADFYRQLGKNLAEIRKQRKMSRDTLALALGVSRSSVMMTELGKQRVPVDRICQIASLLAVSVESLLPSFEVQTRLDTLSRSRITDTAALKLMEVLDGQESRPRGGSQTGVDEI